MQDSQTININASYDGSYAISSNEHYRSSLKMPLIRYYRKIQQSLTVKNAHRGAHSGHTATASRRSMAAYVDAKADVNK